jgi:hypothetical protein
LERAQELLEILGPRRVEGYTAWSENLGSWLLLFTED